MKTAKKQPPRILLPAVFGHSLISRSGQRKVAASRARAKPKTPEAQPLKAVEVTLTFVVHVDSLEAFTEMCGNEPAPKK